MSGDILPAPNPWIPEQDAARLKVLGKLGEEAGELATIVCRCVIQGIDEAEPITGKVNRIALEDDIADVLANIEHACGFFGLDAERMAARAERKLAHITAWREMIPQGGAA